LFIHVHHRSFLIFEPLKERIFPCLASKIVRFRPLTAGKFVGVVVGAGTNTSNAGTNKCQYRRRR
jgi:hypothetical protein